LDLHHGIHDESDHALNQAMLDHEGAACLHHCLLAHMNKAYHLDLKDVNAAVRHIGYSEMMLS
jgi:hypothetical protein